MKKTDEIGAGVNAGGASGTARRAGSDADDDEIDPALLEECERRWERYKRGETKSYSWEEVKARIWK